MLGIYSGDVVGEMVFGYGFVIYYSDNVVDGYFG